MSFQDSFSISEPVQPRLERGAGIWAGAYDAGLVSVLPKGKQELLDEWRWLVPQDAEPVALTGFGDVFYRSGGALHFLDVQRGHTEFVDRDETWFFEEFLTNPEIRSSVLREPLFKELTRRHGGLRYRQCFVLEPWQLLGGQEAPENFRASRIDEYLHLVGQALSTRLRASDPPPTHKDGR